MSFRRMMPRQLVQCQVLNIFRQPKAAQVVWRQTFGSCRSISRFSLFLDSKLPLVHVMQKRFKKKSSSQNKQTIEDEDDVDSDSDSDLASDAKIIHTAVISLRLDAIWKACFNMPRAKFEKCFYNGLVRVNGERVAKKSYEVREGDEIDFIRGFNIEDRHQLDINRVTILAVDDKAASSGRIRLSFRKISKLTIGNYQSDPYDGAL